MFKVGDKVCDPILGLNGVVTDVNFCCSSHPVRVDFPNDSFCYTASGKSLSNFMSQRLYHGHMEEGTEVKIVFTPKKEPVYEWQWLVRNPITGKFYASLFYKTEEEAKDKLDTFGEIHSRIEESKREVKT